MDLELMHQPLEEYIPVYRASWGQEETLESIVPDSLPDVARIITVSGEAYTKEKLASDGKVRLSGSIRAVILYIPDGEDLPRAMEITMPFQADRDDPRLRPDLTVHGSVSAASCDARVMNPRKILLRCDLTCEATVYEKSLRSLTSGIRTEQDPSVEMQIGTHVCRVVSAVAEKTFLFSDVLKPSAAKPPVEELLFSRLKSNVCEGKVIGRKLVCKGDLSLSVLYRSGRSIVPVQFELPYSQIIELEGEWPEAEPEVSLTVRQTDLRLQEGEFEVSAEAMLQGCVRVSRELNILQDAYSTAYPLDAERTEAILCTGAELQRKRQQVRHFCESGVPAKQILDCHCAVKSLLAEQADNAVKCDTQFHVDILYLSEDDALCGTSYVVPASLEIPAAPDAGVRWSCRPVGEAAAVPVTGGLEVRFECEYDCLFTQESHVLCVTGVKRSESFAGTEPLPSVIIRISGANETLWDIAKSCGAAIKDICAANGITGDGIPEGMNLLIPVKKNP